jgi:hypothetical protein
MTYNLSCVCDQVYNKILNTEFKGDKYFVDEVETQLREKPLRGSQTQDIHYSENKASNKAITLTYP